MSAYLSPDVVVAIARQRQHDTETQASRLRLAKLAESGQSGKAGGHLADMKSALLTRAGSVLFMWPRQTSRRSTLSVGPFAARYQA
jgi:hypothetical protein